MDIQLTEHITLKDAKRLWIEGDNEWMRIPKPRPDCDCFHLAYAYEQGRKDERAEKN